MMLFAFPCSFSHNERESENESHIENRLVVAKGGWGGAVGEGWLGGLGLADANYYI